MRNKGIPSLPSYKSVEIIEEVEAFFVGNTGKCVVRVFPSEVNNQFCELVVCAKKLHGFLEGFPSDDCREMEMFISMNLTLDSSLNVGCPPLIEPEVLPRCVRDKVSGPTMSKLMCNDIDV